MGYLTEYELTATQHSAAQPLSLARKKDITQWMLDQGDDFLAFDILEHGNVCVKALTGVSWRTAGTKWHDHEDHLKALSRAFPSYLFELEGVGDEYEDLWRKYALGGVVIEVRPEMVWPTVDQDSFKEVPPCTGQ